MQRGSFQTLPGGGNRQSEKLSGMVPIFLDWDGVVVDSTQLYLDLLKRICSQHNKVLPVTDVDEFRSWYRSNWEENFYEVGFTHREYLQICDEYPDTLDYREAPFFEGVEDLIRGLASRHPLVVVSTAPTRPIIDRLRQAGLHDLFESVTGSDDGSTEKEERLAGHLARLGSKTGVMVGDTDLDVYAGRANGLSTVGVGYGMVDEARLRAANFIVTHPNELAEAIRLAGVRAAASKN